MLLKLGIKNLKHNLIMNLLLIIQMTVVLLLAVSMVSTIVTRFQYYTPLKKQLNSNGYFYYIEHGINPATGSTLRQTEELYDLLEGEKEIFATYSPWLSYNDESVNFVSYDDQFIEAYTPEIESGKWFDLTQDQSETVQLVVSQNPYGFKVGDKIKLDSFGNNLNAEIVGILKEGTKIMGFTVPFEKCDCRNAFKNYNYQIEEKPLFILNQKSLLDKNITMQLNGPIFVTYPDDVPNDLLEKNNSIIKTMMTLNITPLNEMKNNSMDYIFSQLYTLFPILICVLILTLVGAVSVSALSAKRQLKNYAVYYICGLKWKQCAKVNFYSSLICIVFSFLLSITAVTAIQIFNIFDETVIQPGIWQLAGCIILTVFYLILSIALPISIIGKNTPHEVLKLN